MAEPLLICLARRNMSPVDFMVPLLTITPPPPLPEKRRLFLSKSLFEISSVDKTTPFVSMTPLDPMAMPLEFMTNTWPLDDSKPLISAGPSFPSTRFRTRLPGLDCKKRVISPVEILKVSHSIIEPSEFLMVSVLATDSSMVTVPLTTVAPSGFARVVRGTPLETTPTKILNAPMTPDTILWFELIYKISLSGKCRVCRTCPPAKKIRIDKVAMACRFLITNSCKKHIGSIVKTARPGSAYLLNPFSDVVPQSLSC